MRLGFPRLSLDLVASPGGAGSPSSTCSSFSFPLCNRTRGVKKRKGCYFCYLGTNLQGHRCLRKSRLTMGFRVSFQLGAVPPMWCLVNAIVSPSRDLDLFRRWLAGLVFVLAILAAPSSASAQDVASQLHRIEALTAAGRREEALPIARDLQAELQASSATPFELISANHVLGSILANLEHHSEAAPYLRQAVSILISSRVSYPQKTHLLTTHVLSISRAGGESDFLLAFSLVTLGHEKMQTGRADLSDALALRARRICNKLHGEKSECPVSILHSIGDLEADLEELTEDVRALTTQLASLESAGKYEEAIPVAERLLSVLTTAVPVANTQRLILLQVLANLYKETGKPHQAVSALEEVIRLREEDADTPVSQLDLKVTLAGHHITLANYDAAIRILESVLDELFSLPEDSSLRETALSYLAVAYEYEGRYGEAKKIFQDLIRSAQSRGAPDEHLVPFLDQLALIAFVSAQFSDCLDPARRSYEIRTQAPAKHAPAFEKGPEQGLTDADTSFPTLVKILATCYSMLGHPLESLKYNSVALELYTSSSPPHMSGIANAAGGISQAHFELGNLDDAIRYQERSIAARRSLLTADSGNRLAIDRDLIRDEVVLALIVAETGRYDEAVRRTIAAVLASDSLPADDSVRVFALEARGRVQHQIGDFRGALKTYEDALAILEDWKDQPRPTEPTSAYARVWSAETGRIPKTRARLAAAQRSLGKYRESRRILQEVIHSIESRIGSGHPDLLFPLNELVILEQRLGNYEEAARASARALEIATERYGSNSPSIATFLSNLADQLPPGADSRRRELYDRSVELREAAGLSDHPTQAGTLLSLARLEAADGRVDRAMQLAHRAYEITRSTYGRDHPSTAFALLLVGRLAKHQGHLTAARDALDEVISIMETVPGRDHPDLAGVWGSVMALRWTSEDMAGALDAAANMVGISESTSIAVLQSGTEEQRRQFMATLMLETDTLIGFAAAAPENLASQARALAFLTSSQRKGRTLDSVSAGLAIVRRRTDDKSQELLTELMTARTELANLVYVEAEDPTEVARAARYNKVRKRVRRVEEQIRDVPGFEFALARMPQFDEVQSALPESAVLLDFVSYRPLDPRSELDRWGERRYGVFVLPSEGALRWADLGPADPIDQEIRALLAWISNPFTRSKSNAAEVLYQRVIHPVGDAIAEKEHLIIAPESLLHLIPFEALLGPQGALVLDQFNVSYVSSAKDLVKAKNGDARQDEPTAWLVANPDFGSVTSPSSGRPRDGQLSFLPLPGTAVEANAIRKVYPSFEYLGATRASESAVKSVVRPLMLHIASHAFYVPPAAGGAVDAWQEVALRSDPLARSTVLSRARLQTLGRADLRPLLRSGIALAGANAASKYEEDGILTGLELAALDLRGTKLAVLSACDTGRGDVYRSEGVYGLRRALVMAGAESQVLSLWKVADDSTADLMAYFYGNLSRGAGRAEALRKAKQQLRTSPYAHPFYWAPFVLSGDWRPLGLPGTDSPRAQEADPSYASISP